MAIIQILLIVVILCTIVLTKDGPEVTIDQGTVKGKYWKTFNGRTFNSFSAIPYAEPPVGDLRFKPPVPAGPWNGTLNATAVLKVFCPQINVFLGIYNPRGNEDCLYLNVFTPQLPASSNNLLPVMVFLHGGAFICGSSSPHWFGPRILLDKDIVLVTLNYRLGALGFLSTEDEVLPGNNGLKDQTLALQWVKKNIAQFGGDPEKVTVFGQSAGGASAHFHVLSPLSQGLFHRAIAQSGLATALWAVAPKGEAATNAKRLAEFLNCPTSPSQKMVECLKTVDPLEIVRQDKKFMEWSYNPLIPFKPVVEPDIDGAFIAEHPINIIKSGKAADVPFMTGITTQDGAMITAAIYEEPNLVKQLREGFEKIIPIILQFESAPDKEEIAEKIRDFYLKDQVIDDSAKSALSDLFTDVIYSFPEILALELHAKYSKQPVYSYLFGYRGAVTFSIAFGDAKHNYGVTHADDLIYLMSNFVFGDYKSTATDKVMIEIMTTLWTNFARTGNPTPETNSLISEKWVPAQDKGLRYYFIQNVTDITMSDNQYIDRAKFWNKITTEADKMEIKVEL